MRALQFIEGVLGKNGKSAGGVREIAADVSGLIETLSPFIQHHTEHVCPYCRKVCCINKHSYYEYEDIVYIYALGEKMLPYREGINDSEPCQFLGECGCTIRRSVRPYRCNWYFCSPLLEHIQNIPAAQYRKFIDCLNQITLKRTNLLEEFTAIAGKSFLK
ncbi:MAG: hypothetical protein AB1632_11125 [Nitrospirota bacterium]